MTTYVLRDGKLVEKHRSPPLGGLFHAMRDIAPFATIDGTEITSRSALREYERANGVRQVGNDWSGSEKPSFWDERRGRRERTR